MTDFGFIGCGHMGSVLAGIAASDKKNSVYISDSDAERVAARAKEFGAKAASNAQIAKECRYIVLCVRPQDLGSVCKEISPFISVRNDVTVINIAVGITLQRTKELLNITDAPVIRMMPNTPLSVSKGVILYSTSNVRSEDESVFKKTFGVAGKLYSIPEELMDAAGCISGCGPAFVYKFIDAFAKAGVEIGLPDHLAFSLALKTIEGAVKMAEVSSLSPKELCAQVCSKGGTTEAGVKIIEGSDFENIMTETVQASLKRTIELKS